MKMSSGGFLPLTFWIWLLFLEIFPLAQPHVQVPSPLHQDSSLDNTVTWKFLSVKIAIYCRNKFTVRINSHLSQSI